MGGMMKRLTKRKEKYRRLLYTTFLVIVIWKKKKVRGPLIVVFGNNDFIFRNGMCVHHEICRKGSILHFWFKSFLSQSLIINYSLLIVAIDSFLAVLSP